ncbi:MAG: carotenoid oxygenase family protein, partial [Halobacteria archaeon]|nr:carotenoid oxygenase family protein [Halobacteria archaeon]
NYAEYNASDYRYAYGVGNLESPPEDFANCLVKVDVKQGDSQVWSEEATYPGEPVFVASPDAESEDDGVILSVVLDSQNEKSFLLVLDASTFDELARAEAPHAIPFGFHGSFYENS